MRLGAIAENPIEWAAQAAGLVPTPVIDTLVALLLARAVIVGTQVGVFEALAAGPLPADEIAGRCGLAPQATAKLLDGLTGAGYLRYRQGRYALARVARKWLLKDSPTSLADAVLLQALDAQYIARMEEYVRSGEPVRMHAEMTDDEWGLYQRGMRSGATIATPEIVRRLRLPAGARDLLDIGGAHGYYTVALCRRHPGLRAVILDLPQAVAHAAPILAQEGMGDRVTQRSGDALGADLGAEAYDVVLVFNLMHHFLAEQNRDLTRRIARALRPGGIMVIGENIRPPCPGAGGQLGALADLYFAVTSEGGTWSFAELAGWQREAGLRPRRPLRLITGPGAGLQIGVKPREEGSRR
jgi:SAM-dependent methyltransferase